jgi:uncharacterized protein (TIGR01777 family)
VTSPTDGRHGVFGDAGSWRIAITGSSGLIGSALVPTLLSAGHRVTRLVRPESGSKDASTIPWDPMHGQLEARRLEGFDAIIHLAGDPVAERWTAEHKRNIRESRLRGTGVLATALATLDRPPRVLLSASAIGYYGDRGDTWVDETSKSGDDFLAQVSREWEAATEPAAARGIRVVNTRFGVALSPRGGALAQLLPVFRLGGGGRVGTGRQWLSWIALDDLVSALHFALFAESLSGPVNVVAPNPATNAEFAHTLGVVLGRPSVIAVPAFVVRAMFGEMAESMLLAGQRVRPSRLVDAGFAFKYPTLELALRHELGKQGRA